jgi:hypothetical protein
LRDLKAQPQPAAEEETENIEGRLLWLIDGRLAVNLLLLLSCAWTADCSLQLELLLLPRPEESEEGRERGGASHRTARIPSGPSRAALALR